MGVQSNAYYGVSSNSLAGHSALVKNKVALNHEVVARDISTVPTVSFT
jgi:hypothetical protein